MTSITLTAERKGIKRPKKIVTPQSTFALKSLLGEGGFGCTPDFTRCRSPRSCARPNNV
jgi:hypothetical protein